MSKSTRTRVTTHILTRADGKYPQRWFCKILEIFHDWNGQSAVSQQDWQGSDCPECRDLYLTLKEMHDNGTL